MVNTRLIIKAILIFIFGLLLTLKGWYIAGVFADIIKNATHEGSYSQVLLVIFWIGFVVMWLMAQVILPIYLVIRGTRTSEER